MLDPYPPDRQECQNQNQFSVSDGATHNNEQYPFLREFSDLITRLSRKELEPLLSHQQKLFATAIWEAENYGGSTKKFRDRLTELYGPHFKQILSSEELREHMTPIEDYYRYILRLDHRRQWDNQKKSAKLASSKDSE